MKCNTRLKWHKDTTLVIKQKGCESQTGGNNKTKRTKFSDKRIFLTCAYQGSKKCLFFGKFGVLGFNVTSVLTFALSPYDRQPAFLCTLLHFWLDIHFKQIIPLYIMPLQNLEKLSTSSFSWAILEYCILNTSRKAIMPDFKQIYCFLFFRKTL